MTYLSTESNEAWRKVMQTILKQVAFTIVSPFVTLAGMLVIFATISFYGLGIGVFGPLIVWANHEVSTLALVIYFIVYASALAIQHFYSVSDLVMKLFGRGMYIIAGLGCTLFLVACIATRFGW